MCFLWERRKNVSVQDESKLTGFQVELKYVEEFWKGQKSGQLRKFDLNPQIAENSFSLIFAGKSIDFSCASKTDFDLWSLGLVKVINKARAENTDLGYPTFTFKSFFHLDHIQLYSL